MSRSPLFVGLSSMLLLGLQAGDAQEPHVFTPEIMELAVIAANISSILYDNKGAELLATDYPIPVVTTSCVEHICHDAVSSRGGFYTSEPEVAFTGRVENTCVMAFRGTAIVLPPKEWIKDWKTNLDQIQVPLQDDCSVTAGILGAYQVGFQVDAEEDMLACLSSCPECTLLITGHSQGGALANVAGVRFESLGYSPYVMTFGQPKVLGKLCRVNSSRWFRFILAMPGLFRLKYDLVPMLPGTGTFYGHEVILSSEDLSGMDYVGWNKHLNKMPWSLLSHHYKIYVYTLNGIRDNGFPVRISGFRNGVKCTKGSECDSGKCLRKWLIGPFRCTA